MSRKDSRAKRKKELVKLAKDAVARIHRSKTGGLAARWEIKDVGELLSPQFHDDLHYWDIAARFALKLDKNDYLSTALRAAFREFGFDPVDPFSWRRLLELFAYLEFGKPPSRKAGAPIKWNDKRLAELQAAIEELPNLTAKEQARKLANKLGVGRHGLEKAISKAKRARKK